MNLKKRKTNFHSGTVVPDRTDTSLFRLGNYERVFYLTDKILNNHNKRFQSCILLEEKSIKYKEIWHRQKEFEKAVFIIPALQARKALDSLVRNSKTYLIDFLANNRKYIMII